MANHRNWAWQPDGNTVAAIKHGNEVIRRRMYPREYQRQQENEMAKVAKKKAKKVAKKKGSSKKIDGKALAAKRKPRDTVAQFIKDQLAAGKRDVAKILTGAKENFPGAKPTNGYVRWIAKGEGIKDLSEPVRAAAPKTEKAKTKAKKKVEAKGEASPDPAS
jgi:hypothetical protein